MRTIAEIKKQMTDQILADIHLVQRLSLDTSKTWDEQVSSVSVINMLLYVVAVANYATEWLFEQFKGDVENRIASAYPGSISWYWNKAMEYQDNETANKYLLEHGVYESESKADRIIKHVSVDEDYNIVNIKVSGENYEPLSDKQLERFRAYINAVKFAGTWVSVTSNPSDKLSLVLKVWRNGLFNVGQDAIKLAVENYLNGIRYGGTFNKTRLIDAVQQVTGVEDVVIESCSFDASGDITILDGQNYKSVAGHIKLDSQKFTIIYEQI